MVNFVRLKGRVWAGALALMAGLWVTAAGATETHPAFVGKNDWVFYERELSPEIEQKGVTRSIELIDGLNQALSRKGVALVVTLVPIKARLYADNLPDGVTLTPAQQSRYGQWVATLRQVGVSTVDLNTPFMASPLRASDTPLYFRLDTHWAPPGATLAAQTLQAHLEADPKLKATLAAIPTATVMRTVSKGKRMTRSRDLVAQLPPEQAQQKFAVERFFQSSFELQQGAGAALTGTAPVPRIAVVGSSYSIDWTEFVDQLRFALQRDIVNASVPATLGQWVGMAQYLDGEAFQKQAPRLIVWEIPERDLYASPDAEGREARYQTPNDVWLRTVTEAVARAAAPQ